MAESQLESLLAPISADAPCGPDLEYDPAFQAMLDAGAGKPERQYVLGVGKARKAEAVALRSQAVALGAGKRGPLAASVKEALAQPKG